MEKYENLSRKELVEKIRELEEFIEILKKEKDKNELLKFPWVGNLGHWYWKVDTNTVIYNKQKIIALGYDPHEVPKNLGYEFFTEKLHSEDYFRVMENMRRHLRGETPVYEVEYRIKTKDGSWKWFYDRGLVTKRDKDKKPLLVVGIVFDITHLKKTETLLEEKNKKLEELATIDELTKIYNRRTTMEKLRYEIKRVQNNKGKLSILMLDLDDFKMINDRYGHLVGDQILKTTAQIIKNNVRNIDIVGRYGGEEFIVVMPDCSLQEAVSIAERIRKIIEYKEFLKGIKLTISGGLKQYNNDCVDSIINLADKCLYNSKRKGKNHICIYEDNKGS